MIQLKLDYRLLTLFLLLALSAASLLLPSFIKKQGVYVARLSENAKCRNIDVGDSITEIGGMRIKKYEDFIKATSRIKAGDFVPIVSNNLPANCVALADGNLGFEVKEYKKASALKFGIDIQGGTRALLQANATQQEILDAVTILNQRINMYGLSDIRVLPVGSNLIQIEAAGLKESDIRDFLAKQGFFEGKLVELIELKNGSGELIINYNQYRVTKLNGKIKINQSLYGVNESFYLNGIKFEVYNLTDEYATLAANVFTGKDIVNILTDPQHSYVVPFKNGYRFVFTIQISKTSASRFANLTAGQPTYWVGGESYIRPKLVLYLDEKPITELNIVAELAGKAIETPSIQGFGRTAKEAQDEKLKLQTILRSGSLPVELKLVRVDTITQTAGKRLLEAVVYAAVAIAITVSIVVFLRYRDLKIALPMVLLSWCEILLILGIASSQVLAGLIVMAGIFIGVYYKEIRGFVGWITVGLMVLTVGFVIISSWTLDIPAIAGLIAVLGTGVNQMIIIADQLLLEREKTLKQRYNSALEIINNSASMVTFAMLPLIFLGVGTLRGFAITTIVGVFVGLLITRPAYMSIVERLEFE